MFLRNRFLNTAAFFSDPREPAAGATDTGNDDQGGGNGNDDAGDDTGAQAGQDAGDTGNDAGGDGDGENDPDGEPGADAEDDDDPDLADLTPEQRKKVKDRIERETRWRDRQLDRLHAKRRSVEEDNRALTAIADPARRAAAGTENLTAAQIEERAKVLATEMTAQQQYDADANRADAEGRATYGDKWASSMAKIPKLGSINVADMVDILATDKPHVVLYGLSDPDTYERVMSLPPARRRNEFVKLSLQDAPKPRGKTADSKRPGNAPPPVNPVSGGRRVAAQAVNLHDDKTEDEKWYAERNRTRRKKFSNVD